MRNYVVLILKGSVFLSREYKELTTKKYEQQINKLLTTAPYYIKDFYDHMHRGRREITTQAAYIRDIIHFINYINNSIPSMKEKKIKDFPIEIFNSLTVKDLNEYRTWLGDEQRLSNTSINLPYTRSLL